MLPPLKTITVAPFENAEARAARRLAEATGGDRVAYQRACFMEARLEDAAQLHTGTTRSTSTSRELKGARAFKSTVRETGRKTVWRGGIRCLWWNKQWPARATVWNRSGQVRAP